MQRDSTPDGWSWIAGRPTPEPTSENDAPHRLARAFANCFAGADGALALEHLRRAFLDRRLAPSASDAELRHLEGQRALAAHIAALVARGREGSL